MLNLFSTLVMVRLGRVHRGLMVDMNARNDKLRERAVRMLSELSGEDDATVRAALDAAGGRVKTAVLVLRGLDRAGANIVTCQPCRAFACGAGGTRDMKALRAGRLFDGAALRPERVVLFDGARIAGWSRPTRCRRAR